METKREHTPGPWELRGSYDAGVRAVFGPGGDIARINIRRRGRVEIAANEALIAAAPELLAALEALQVEAWKGRTGNVKKDFSLLLADSAARAAIAKAKGG